jgi:hypothetical protein
VLYPLSYEGLVTEGIRSRAFVVPRNLFIDGRLGWDEKLAELCYFLVRREEVEEGSHGVSRRIYG